MIESRELWDADLRENNSRDWVLGKNTINKKAVNTYANLPGEGETC